MCMALMSSIFLKLQAVKQSCLTFWSTAAEDPRTVDRLGCTFQLLAHSGQISYHSPYCNGGSASRSTRRRFSTTQSAGANRIMSWLAVTARELCYNERTHSKMPRAIDAMNSCDD